MLARESWAHLADAVGLGERKDFPHDCGPGEKLRISRDHRGWSAWCFRCSDGGFIPAAPPSLAERLAAEDRARAAGLEASGRAADAPPEPAVRDVGEWPAGAAVWLYRAGLSRADIGRLGVYYHPGTDRVVVPVLGPSGPIFWQARALRPWQKPKYLGPKNRPRDLIATWGTHPDVTLTEDMLSAIKIGMAGGTGLCLFGTHLQDHVLAHLIRKGCRVNVWMDPDTAGRSAAAKIARRLESVGVQRRVVHSEHDPKLHTVREINALLGKEWT